MYGPTDSTNFVSKFWYVEKLQVINLELLRTFEDISYKSGDGVIRLR